MTPETDKERDEAQARVEIITPSKNNPVAEYFSSSNTPETDAAVIASNGQWSFVLKETCQRLERERDEAMEALSGRTVSCAACNHAAIERDKAREEAEYWKEAAKVPSGIFRSLEMARDQAKRDAEYYRARYEQLKDERESAK